MLEMIYAIPEEFGWIMVGVVGTLCVMMLCKIAKTIIVAHFFDKDEEEEEEENF